MGALAASRARWWEVVGNSEIVKSGIKRVGLHSDPRVFDAHIVRIVQPVVTIILFVTLSLCR